MNIKLKPCPFCGEDKSLELNTYEVEGDGFWHDPVYKQICCLNCGASSGSVDEYENNSEIKVTKLWNNRK